MRGAAFAALLVLGLIPAAPHSAAAAAADFSGTWRLDAARSDYGSRPRPRERVERITHHGGVLSDSSFTVRESGDTLAFAFRYFTDGREAVNAVMGQEVRTKSSWEGGRLRLESHAKLLLVDIAVIELWELAARGRELIVTRESRMPMGSTKQRLVFVRR